MTSDAREIEPSTSQFITVIPPHFTFVSKQAQVALIMAQTWDLSAANLDFLSRCTPRLATYLQP